MRRAKRAFMGLLLFFVCVLGGEAQTPPDETTASEGATPMAPPVAAPLAGGDCGEPPPSDDPCMVWVCTSGTWEERPTGSGTVCDDGNLCTHTDRCDGAGSCRGQDISAQCASQCKRCNGTATCSTQNAAVGSACSGVPGFDSACGCTSGGACTVKAFTSGAAATGLCWDARGNMRARYVAPVGSSCMVACPSP